MPSHAVASKTTVFGIPSKMVAGQRHEFSVIPKDIWGNPGATGATVEALLDPILHDAEQTKCLVLKGAGGSLTVSAECLKSGMYSLSVYLRHDSGSCSEEIIVQKRLTVEDAATAATSCSVLSYWPERGAVAGIAAGFLIQVQSQSIHPTYFCGLM